MTNATMAKSILALGAMLLGSGAASAQIPWVDPEAVIGGPTAKASQIILLVSPTLEFPAVTAPEILGAASNQVDVGTGRVTLGAGLAGKLGDPTGGLSVSTAVRRTVDPIYQAWVRNARGNLSDIQVEYELFGRTGTRDRLEHQADDGSFVRVRGLPFGPWTVLKVGPWRLIQGGGIFDFEISQASMSGPYEGTLSVVVNSL